MTAVSEVLASSGTVQVYSGKTEILVTRTETMKKPLMSVYGLQEEKKEEIQAEFDEIFGQMTHAKLRGDLCVVAGDLNRHIGDLSDKVRGGPFTWHHQRAGPGPHYPCGSCVETLSPT